MCESGGILRAEELRVRRKPDIDQAPEGLRTRSRGRWGGVEGRELDRVAIDLADVEVGTDFGDFGRGDVVGGAPDALGGLVLLCVRMAFRF